MKFWITREEGEEWPRGYGLVTRHNVDGRARGTIIPFNLVIGWARNLYWKVRFGWAPPPSWQDNRNAYLTGLDVGYQSGYDAGYELGSHGG